ncbi:uncharacterized protein I206_105641 [Kwoniella pini CBS 10737]|uniref:Uncharacterized protein n=1 Tax=Kwoniella pini CBS 10737 TaxID=1296096 RepID=A0AAJ8L8X1_9TREE
MPDPNILKKRIVMNPPASFIQYAATLQPSNIQSNGLMMIDSNGQAVLLNSNTQQVESNSQIQNQNQQQNQNQDSLTTTNSIMENTTQQPEKSEKDETNDDGQVVLKGDQVVLVAPSSTLNPTSTEIISSIISMTSSTTISITSASAISISTTSSTTSNDFSSFSTSNFIPTSTSQIPTSTSFISSTTSSTFSKTSSISSTSSHSSTNTSSSASGSHKPPSAGIIFLIILLSLTIFIALISLFRYIIKSGRLNIPCMKRRNNNNDDDDGLSDLVRGFDTPRTLGGGGFNPYLHTINYPSLEENNQFENENENENELKRRSSLFSHEKPNGNSPFLHSQSISPNPNYYEQNQTENISKNLNLNLPQYPISAYHQQQQRQRQDENVILPLHLFGETGPLEVRNALPGEVDNDFEVENEVEVVGIDGLVGLGLGQGSPRFLGVNDGGLPVPWSTPLPPRPSSIDSFDNNQINPNPFGSSSTLAPPLRFVSPSLSHDEILPQRSATWASNLRNTLYNAISAARAPSVIGNHIVGEEEEEDKFTRTVGNIYRSSSNRRKAIPTFDLEKGGNGLIVVSEKDDSISDMNGTKRAGERFKGYYARSKSSTSVSMTDDVGSEDGEISQVQEEFRPPTRLAGGARAAGARTGSFVVV